MGAWNIGKCFWKISLHRMNRQQLALETQEVLQIHIANPCLWAHEDLQPKVRIWKIHKTLQYLHRDLHGSFQLGILPLMQKELVRRIAWLKNQGIKSRKCISVNSLILRNSSVEKRDSKPRYVPVYTSPRKRCCGSKKLRWSNQCTLLRRRDEFENTNSRILRCLMRRLRPTCRCSSRTRTLRRKSVWRCRTPTWKTDVSVEDRLRS